MSSIDIQWTKFLDVLPDGSISRSFALGLDDSIYIAGLSNLALESNQDAFLVKFNKDGKKEWTRDVFVTAEDDQATAVKVNKFGEVYVTGETGSYNSLSGAGDWDALQKLPKNSAKVRLHNRCKLTGRPKGYIRQFGISRVTFRKMALEGMIPGVTKASW